MAIFSTNPDMMIFNFILFLDDIIFSPYAMIYVMTAFANTNTSHLDLEVLRATLLANVI